MCDVNALVRSKGFAVSKDDVRRRFGDVPLTSEIILQALATVATAPAMVVEANTSDSELDAFLFDARSVAGMSAHEKE